MILSRVCRCFSLIEEFLFFITVGGLSFKLVTDREFLESDGYCRGALLLGLE
jgi:hypothetical protein